MSEPLFEARGLRAGFDGITVISIDSLRLPEGGITVLIGENGSGKTTLLRLLNGLLTPTAGLISYRGQRIDDGGLAALRAESVMLHQAPLLFRGSVLQNVGFGLRIRGVSRTDIIERTRRALLKVGMPGVERRRASSLSGGEKQRVALARALALQPRVLLLDEPSSSVDPQSRVLVETVIRDTAAAGATVIMSTHTMELAYRLSDTLHRMEGGRILPASENILKGTVEGRDEQFTLFRAGGAKSASGGADTKSASGGALLRCPARDGDFRVAVLPYDELILSREPLASSARNQLRGKVIAVTAEDGLLRVSIDCGVVLHSLVTRESARELGVAPGSDCVVTFKASAVRLY
jgi:tungstate transport system ATP-binding protein